MALYGSDFSGHGEVTATYWMSFYVTNQPKQSGPLGKGINGHHAAAKNSIVDVCVDRELPHLVKKGNLVRNGEATQHSSFFLSWHGERWRPITCFLPDP